MAPKDIARSYPKRGLTADVGFRSEPKFCGDGSTNFNGSSDFATATNYAGGNAGGTFCFWFKTEAKATNQVIFSNANVTPKDAKAQVWIISSTIKFSDTVDAIEIPSGGFDANQWHFGCMVLNSTDGIERAYFDGVEHSTTISFGSGATTTSLAIGSRSHTGSTFFKGNLAKFKIFNVALTKDQVLELYNNPGLDVPTGLTSSNLRRNYELETDFNDSGADSENATASGSPSFTVDRPQLPRGLSLTQNAAQARVYTGRALDQDGSVDRLQGTNFTDATATACTVSFWMYQRDGGPGRIIHNFGGGAGSVDRFLAAMNAGSFFILGEVSAGVRSGYLVSSLPLNQWHHVVFVLDGNGTTALDTVILYLNGEKYDSPSNYSFVWDTTTFDIGGTSHGYQNQLIAGVKVFNTKLTDAQARELYHNPEQVLPTGVSASNLKRYYPLSDYNDTGGTGGRYFQDMGADGEPAEDKGSALMSFAQPVPCPQLGLQQSATRLYYDGTSGTTYNVEVTGHSLNLPSFSIAFWGFFQSNNPNTTSCCFDTSGGGTFQYFINSTAGNLTVYNGAPTATFNGAVPRDEWVHVVITGHDSSPYIKCYVNGAEKTINSGSAATVGLVATNYYLFSRSANTLSHTGFGDNYSIYDSNLGASEALELYNQGIGYDPRTNVGNYTSASSLIRLYKFDDLTTVKDYSGNNAHADVNGTFKAASFPENASGSTIVGDFSMKRKGVSVLNPTATPAVLTVAPGARIANDGSLSPDPSKGGYSFSTFIRFEQASGANPWFPMVFSGTNYNNTSQRYVLNFGNYSVATVPPGISISDGSTPRDYDWPSVLSNPEEWHQLAFTIDYTTSPNTTFKLYLDGALVSTQATHAHSAFDPGDILVSSYPYGNGNFPGAIACFKMYQAKLSDNEIEQIYRSDLRLIKGLENV